MNYSPSLSPDKLQLFQHIVTVVPLLVALDAVAADVRHWKPTATSSIIIMVVNLGLLEGGFVVAEAQITHPYSDRLAVPLAL